MVIRHTAVTMLVALGAQATLACIGTEPPTQATMRRGDDRTTCAEVEVQALPPDLQAIRRQLVPYSPTQLAVESTFADDERARTVTVISGTYLDEVLEAYDDLEPTTTRTIDGRTAMVLTGSFVGSRVTATVWRQPEMTTPCDSRAVVTVGLGPAETDRLEIIDQQQTDNGGTR